MDVTLHIEADAAKTSIYRVSTVEMDPDAVDWEDKEELERTIETLHALSESGELDLAGENTHLFSVDPEGIREILFMDELGRQERLDLDTITLYNEDPDDFARILQNAREGEIFYLRSERGEGYWDLRIESDETESDPTKLSMAYLECSTGKDTYDVLRESYYAYLCDGVDPSRIRYDGKPMEIVEAVFRPTLITGALYRTVWEPHSQTLVLERLPVEPRVFLDELDTMDS
ncbi:hypothetical protein [Nitratifractor sp.]